MQLSQQFQRIIIIIIIYYA